MCTRLAAVSLLNLHPSDISLVNVDGCAAPLAVILLITSQARMLQEWQSKLIKLVLFRLPPLKAFLRILLLLRLLNNHHLLLLLLLFLLRLPVHH